MSFKKIRTKKTQIDIYIFSTNLNMKLLLFKQNIFGLSKIYLPQDIQTMFNKNNSISNNSVNLILSNLKNKNLNKFYFKNVAKKTANLLWFYLIKRKIFN